MDEKKVREAIEEYEKKKCSGESLSAFESGINRGCLEAKKNIRSHMGDLLDVDAEEKSILCTIGENGMLTPYDDTYDVIIHCSSKEDQDQTVKIIKESNWIPTSERLPEPYETVLVSAKMQNDNEYLVYEAIKQTSNMWLLAGVANSIDYEVVAWKPLPEPYRPEEG